MNATFDWAVREMVEAGHGARFRADGDSMHPAIRSGDYVHVMACLPSTLKPGEVILTRSERGLTAHRVVATRTEGGTISLITRGDNSIGNDAPVCADAVVGRVEMMERQPGHPVPVITRKPSVRRLLSAARRLRATLTRRR